jgi:hypothetical protein
MSDRIRIFVDGKEVSEEYEDPTAVAIECWYDRHYRHWVIYPVDAEGNQLEEATYGFGKKEAEQIKAEMEERLIGQQIFNAYVQYKKEVR